MVQTVLCDSDTAMPVQLHDISQSPKIVAKTVKGWVMQRHPNWFSWHRITPVSGSHRCVVILIKTKAERELLGNSLTDGQWNDKWVPLLCWSVILGVWKQCTERQGRFQFLLNHLAGTEFFFLSFRSQSQPFTNTYACETIRFWICLNWACPDLKPALLLLS